MLISGAFVILEVAPECHLNYATESFSSSCCQATCQATDESSKASGHEEQLQANLPLA